VLVYRDGVDFYEPCCLEDGKRGTVDFDTSFSLSTAQQQDYFVSTCDAVAPFYTGCLPLNYSGNPGVFFRGVQTGNARARLVKPPDGDDGWCWVKIFKAQFPNAADRTGDQFLPALNTFRAR
jgi:hypothetical protein